jgi:hypothetical protein
MKRISRCLAAVFIAVFALPGMASAQKTYALGFGGGVAIPVGTLGDTQDTGLNGLVSLVLGAAELPVGFRIDGIYARMPQKSGTTPTAGSSSAPNFRVLGILGNGIYAFSGSSAKIYIIAGGGLYNTRLDVGRTKSANHLGLNTGAGITFGVGPIASFIEARYHFISRQPAQGGVVHFVPITFGFMF